MIKFQKLENYIKSQQKEGEHRKYLRLNTRLPVLYGFPIQDEKTEFRQCYTMDISNGGIAINIIEPPPFRIKRFLKLDQPILLKMEIPHQDKVIEFSGKLKWYNTLQVKGLGQYTVGLSFNQISPDDKITLLAYTIKSVNSKKIGQISLTLFIIAFILTGIFAITTEFTKQKTEKKLIISTLTQKKLMEKIKELSDEKNELENEIKNITQSINKQDTLLKQQQKIMNERSIVFNNSKYLLTDIYKEWNIDSSSDFLTFDKLYRQAQQSIRDKKYKLAIQSLEELIKKYPNALLGYRLLVLSYYKDGQEEKANEIFNFYTQKIKEEILKE